MWPASIDPLFGGVYYAALNEDGGSAGIFGSALLKEVRSRTPFVNVQRSKEEYAKQVVTASSVADDVVVVVGKDVVLTRLLPHADWRSFEGRDWVILEKRTTMKEPHK